MIEKVCSACEQAKDISQFYNKKHGRCRPCYLAYVREQYAENSDFREKMKVKARSLTPEQREKKNANQRKINAAIRDRMKNDPTYDYEVRDQRYQNQ